QNHLAGAAVSSSAHRAGQHGQRQSKELEEEEHQHHAEKGGEQPIAPVVGEYQEKAALNQRRGDEADNLVQQQLPPCERAREQKVHFRRPKRDYSFAAGDHQIEQTHAEQGQRAEPLQVFRIGPVCGRLIEEQRQEPKRKEEQSHEEK